MRIYQYIRKEAPNERLPVGSPKPRVGGSSPSWPAREGRFRRGGSVLFIWITAAALRYSHDFIHNPVHGEESSPRRTRGCTPDGRIASYPLYDKKEAPPRAPFRSPRYSPRDRLHHVYLLKLRRGELVFGDDGALAAAELRLDTPRVDRAVPTRVGRVAATDPEDVG